MLIYNLIENLIIMQLIDNFKANNSYNQSDKIYFSKQSNL